MAFILNHLHLKTRDPENTAQWYIDNLGATLISNPGGGKAIRLSLHGMPINVSKFIEGQTHRQVYGMEHIAIDTDDLPGVVASLKANGVNVLEENASGPGRKVCFFEGPDGVCLEVLEIQD